MVLPLPDPRYSLERTADILVVNIPPRRNWPYILFVGFWLCGWAFGEISVIATLLSGRGQGGTIFLLAWLGGWTIGGIWAANFLIHNLAGGEAVTVGNVLTIAKRPLWIHDPVSYDLAHVKRLRARLQEASGGLFGWSRWSWAYPHPAISFDYGARTVSFGAGLDEAEARQLVGTIRLHLGLPLDDS